MSRAHVVSTRILRKMRKESRTPDEALLLSFLGASALLDRYAKDAEKAFSEQLMASSDLPLPPDIPMIPDVPLTSPAPQTVHTESNSLQHDPILPEMGSNALMLQADNPQNKTHSREQRCNDTEELISLLQDLGQKVEEVNPLSETVTRITISDLMGRTRQREPELVRRGR